jgi:hypothetical protein
VKVSYRVTPDGMFQLMIESVAGLNPAGWRLQKGGLFPIDEFEYFDEQSASEAANLLQKYIDSEFNSEPRKKRGRK